MSVNKKQLLISVTYSTVIENEHGFTEADIERYRAHTRSIDDDRLFQAENLIDSTHIPVGERIIDNEVEWSETKFELVDSPEDSFGSKIDWSEIGPRYKGTESW